jgi:hypothetical protein
MAITQEDVARLVRRLPLGKGHEGQERAVAAALDALLVRGHRGVVLADEVGFGKTYEALAVLTLLREHATFGQAVKGSVPLTDLYAKNTLFDYSYRYFYSDGFGKDYQILNLDEDTQRNHLELYLVACLLSFFQQQRLYRDRESAFRPFQIEKPLWIFVGSSVVKGWSEKDATDIIEILQFLAHYVKHKAESIQRIEHVLNQGLITATGKNLFAGRFGYLNTCGLSAGQVFDETLAILFNAPGGGELYVENLKGTGEVALRLGADNDAFGVINVGDDAKLVKLCTDHGLSTGDREFSGSLFHQINQPHSPVKLLIGSKKFTEGWSSWRVSTMGLMNVGYSVNGERRSFALLRPVADTAAQERIRELVLQAYAEHEEQMRDEVA